MLWFLSTVMIGVLGALYTERKACISSVEMTNTRLDRLKTEVINRGIELGMALNDTPADITRLKELMSPKADYTFAEFDKRTLSDLFLELNDLISNRFYVGRIKRTVTKSHRTIEESMRYVTVATTMPSILVSNSLRGAVEDETELRHYVVDLVNMSLVHYTLRPLKSCSIPVLSRELLGLDNDLEITRRPIDLGPHSEPITTREEITKADGKYTVVEQTTYN
jgi:hypothetical protein